MVHTLSKLVYVVCGFSVATLLLAGYSIRGASLVRKFSSFITEPPLPINKAEIHRIDKMRSNDVSHGSRKRLPRTYMSGVIIKASTPSFVSKSQLLTNKISVHKSKGSTKLEPINIDPVVRGRKLIQPSNSPVKKLVATNKKNNKPGKNEAKKKYLIFQCDAVRWCGGWGDRQRGIVGSFLLAQVTDRIFGINMTTPCDLKILLVPAKVNWIIKRRDLKGLSVRTIDNMQNMERINLMTTDFNKKYPQDVIYLRTNGDFIIPIQKSPFYSKRVPAWAKGLSLPAAFRNGWNLLMKYSSHFEEHVEQFMEKIPPQGNLVCAHIRLRQNPSLPNDAASINSVSALKHLWKFLKPYADKASRVFVASDSVEVRKIARDYFKHKEIDTGGLILHVDRQRAMKQACEGFEMALLDQVILTKCRILVVSASNFGVRAGMINAVKERVFMFKNGTITPYNLN